MIDVPVRVLFLAAVVAFAMASAASIGSSAAAAKPKCLGAATRDPTHPCVNRTRLVSPGPDEVDLNPTGACAPIDPLVCAFGADEATARGHVALVGDSHTYHWRTALDVVVRATGWRGYGITAGGCFFSEAVGGFSEDCLGWYHSAAAWLAEHPEVSTLFVTQNADTPVALAPGQTALDVKVDGFRRAWGALPATVKHVVVLRDTPASSQATFDCMRRVIAAAKKRPGTACPLARSVALREDAAVSAARGLRSKRYEVIDMTEFFCGRRNCFPVIGGVLVNRDVFGHITVSYMATLGPYLLRKVRRLMARW